MTEIAEGTKLEIPVLLASFYGLRRSEVLGLKWDAIDFEANTLEIKHIVTQASIDGKKVLVQADRAKTKSSLRTLPLVPPIRDRLLMLKGQQDTYRRLCGKSYNRDYLAICVWTRLGTSSAPTTFPNSSRSCWRKTVCVLSASTTCVIAAPAFFWQMAFP